MCNEMLGRSKYISQGKTTMRFSSPVDSQSQLTEIPKTIKMYYDNVQLSADILYVNEVLFLT